MSWIMEITLSLSHWGRTTTTTMSVTNNKHYSHISKKHVDSTTVKHN